MSKTIVIGDVHGTQWWRYIVDTQEFDHVIFIGDYLDTHEKISAVEQLRNLEDIIAFKKANPDKVTLLIGNHDHLYWPGNTHTNVSGYQPGAAVSFTNVLNENRDLFKAAHSYKNILFTHAGVDELWMRLVSEIGKVGNVPNYTASEIADWVNEVWKYQHLFFCFNGRSDPEGDEIGQTPMWIRPRALMKGSQNIKKAGIVQVCGHTAQKSIDIEGKATGGKYFFIDTLGTSGEYLVYLDGIFSIGNIK